MIQDILTTTLGILRKHGILLIVFFWLVAVLYVGLRDKSPEIIFSQDYFIAIITIIPVLFAIMSVFGLIKSFDWITLGPMQITKIIIFILAFILAISGIFYGIWYINTPQGNSADPIISTDIASQILFFFNIISAAIFIFGLIIFARLLKDVAYSVEGWTGIFLRILFFIPCLLSDLFSYVVGEFSRSPFVVYVLIAIEISLILLYLYLPKLLAKFAFKNESNLLSQPIKLSQPTKIDKHKSLSSLGNVYAKQNANIGMGHRNEYTISLWVYIVGMPSNTYPYNENATIFSLEDSNGKGHPKIMYNGSTNKCVIQYANEPVSIVEFKIPLQKWVHLVIIYNGNENNIDFFMNKQLVKSVPRNWRVKCSPDDTISIGQQNGLQGSVANITHYNRAISKTQVNMLYRIGYASD